VDDKNSNECIQCTNFINDVEQRAYDTIIYLQNVFWSEIRRSYLGLT